MSLFLLSFFLVYGSMHVYALLKARSALAFSPGTLLALLLLLGILLCAPIVTQLLSRHGYEGASRSIAYVGYLWMGFLFFLTCLNLSADLLRLPLWAMERGGIAVNARGVLAGRPAFLCIAGLAVALSAYAVAEACRIEVVRVRIVTDRLPASVPSLRIAQITDLHLGLIHRSSMARKVAAIVAREHPDLLVSSGDLVDGQLDGITALEEILREIPAPRGKIAVLGNHEYYGGIDRSIAFTRKSGFTLLRDEAVTIDNAVRIAGVDDPAGARFGRTDGPSEAVLLGDRPDGRFTILLKHRPQLDPATGGKFDLQLSGHTHNGQIFPFRLLTRLFFPLLAGDHPVPGGGILHVSRGTGTWGPPMRFLAPPEITVVDIERSIPVDS
ncbi:metallophosphoesterase [Candidatus Deferrimicrobium sp.]|uniref:metallophosphoesterase n=1 Tax=Candidatus Deferrimicrobium sp. TaxID=3060586 RepID=UPI002ED6413C